MDCIMTASGAVSVQTPIAGLVELALRDPCLQDVISRAADRPAELTLIGPASARLFAASALAQATPLLVVTATGREADDLTAELRGVFGDSAALFPSWETLPHERLSPGVDTVGARMMVLRWLAHPDDERLGPPLRVVVTTVRSLVQPMAPDVADIEPVTLTLGEEADFDAVIHRLVELAYARVDMVGKRGEFAVRGGIVDVFPPPAEHPVRVEIWGDEVSELRSFAVADHRSAAPANELRAPGCRELRLIPEVRSRAAVLARAHENNPPLRELLEHLAEGIPAEGMESLIPALVGAELELLTDLLPAGAPVLLADPERIRTRAADLVRTGQEFLEASWFAAASRASSTAGIGGDAPIDVGASAYRGLDDVLGHAA